MTTNHPNTHLQQLRGMVEQLHAERRFFPTGRQRELYDSLLGAPCPASDDDSDADRLTLLGYGGAMGGGKTRAIAELAIDAALTYPGNNVLVSRHHLSDLSSTTMKEFFQVCPPEIIQRRQQAPTSLVELRLPTWPQGRTSTVNFRHLSDWRGLGSQQYGAVLIDEAGQVDEDAALMLLTRLRHPAQPQRWFVAASNPWPGWFQRWFVRRDLPEDALREAQGRVSFIPARIADNPHLPDNYAQLNYALLPPHWRDRFIDGSFDALMGRIYPDFDPKIHCWTYPLPRFSHYIGGLDFGGQTNQSHYTAGILAGITRTDSLPHPRRAARNPFSVPASQFSPPAERGEMSRSDRGGSPPHLHTLIRLAEFEDRGPGVIQRLEQWQRACSRKYGRIRWIADRSQSAWIDHQRRRGLKIQPASGTPGSVEYGISLVHNRLTANLPASYYTPDLVQFPLRMSEYVWQSDDDPEPKPRKKNDDLLDADRYMHELAQKGPPARIAIVTPYVGSPARWSVEQ